MEVAVPFQSTSGHGPNRTHRLHRHSGLGRNKQTGDFSRPRHFGMESLAQTVRQTRHEASGAGRRELWVCARFNGPTLPRSRTGEGHGGSLACSRVAPSDRPTSTTKAGPPRRGPGSSNGVGRPDARKTRRPTRRLLVYAATGSPCSIRVPNTARNCRIHAGCAGHAGAVTRCPSVTASVISTSA